MPCLLNNVSSGKADAETPSDAVATNGDPFIPMDSDGSSAAASPLGFRRAKSGRGSLLRGEANECDDGSLDPAAQDADDVVTKSVHLLTSSKRNEPHAQSPDVRSDGQLLIQNEEHSPESAADLSSEESEGDYLDVSSDEVNYEKRESWALAAITDDPVSLDVSRITMCHMYLKDNDLYYWISQDLLMKAGIVKSILLAKNYLTKMPPVLAEFKTLRDLDLKCNVLQEFPVAIFEMPKLDHLDLSHNFLSDFPEGFVHPSLTHVVLAHNDFSRVDSLALTFPRVEILHLGSNKIEALPENMGELSFLRAFDVENNLLSALPESLGDIETLKQDQFFVRHNPIAKVYLSFARKRYKVSRAINETIAFLAEDQDESKDE